MQAMCIQLQIGLHFSQSAHVVKKAHQTHCSRSLSMPPLLNQFMTAIEVISPSKAFSSALSLLLQNWQLDGAKTPCYERSNPVKHNNWINLYMFYVDQNSTTNNFFSSGFRNLDDEMDTYQSHERMCRSMCAKYKQLKLPKTCCFRRRMKLKSENSEPLRNAKCRASSCWLIKFYKRV